MRTFLIPLLVAAATFPLGAQITLNPSTWTPSWYLIEANPDAPNATLTTGTYNQIGVSTVASHTSDRPGAVVRLPQAIALDEVGNYIQFVGNYSGLVGNNINFSIRVGFFDSTGVTVDSDFDPDTASLVGYFGGLATRSGSGANTNVFHQAAGTGLLMGINQGNVTGAGITAIGANVNPLTTGNRTVTYRIERSSDTLLTFTFSDGVNVNLERTLAVASASTLSLDTFAVSFALGSSVSAQFSDMEITGLVIPEPSTYALLFGASAIGLVVWRRRR